MPRKLWFSGIPKMFKEKAIRCFRTVFGERFRRPTPQPNMTPRQSGRAQAVRLYACRLPRLSHKDPLQIVDGDRVTTYKTYYGTHEGDFLGIAPTHRKIHFETVDVMRVRDGKITDHWGIGNLFSLMQQLGVLNF